MQGVDGGSKSQAEHEAGAGYSLLIELSQLLFYERGTDIDDLITNTTGVWIGAVLYFLIRYPTAGRHRLLLDKQEGNMVS